jgi:hypothetical protein
VELSYGRQDMKKRMMSHGIEIKAVGRKYKKSFELEPKGGLLKEHLSE